MATMATVASVIITVYYHQRVKHCLLVLLVLVMLLFMPLLLLFGPVAPLALDNCRQFHLRRVPGMPTPRAVTTTRSDDLVVGEDHLLGPSCQR